MTLATARLRAIADAIDAGHPYNAFALERFERCALTCEWRALPTELKHQIFSLCVDATADSARTVFACLPALRAFLGASVDGVPRPLVDAARRVDDFLRRLLTSLPERLDCRRGVYAHYFCLHDEKGWPRDAAAGAVRAVTQHGRVGIVVMVMHPTDLPVSRDTIVQRVLDVEFGTLACAAQWERPVARLHRCCSYARHRENPYVEGDTYCIELSGRTRPIHHIDAQADVSIFLIPPPLCR